tara:strand:- start:114 stop:398 length:285 start_codon:yes stop_codon:yes gene_type:complete
MVTVHGVWVTIVVFPVTNVRVVRVLVVTGKLAALTDDVALFTKVFIPLPVAGIAHTRLIKAIRRIWIAVVIFTIANVSLALVGVVAAKASIHTD